MNISAEMDPCHAIQKELRKYANPEKATFLPNFFKCAPGEYGEGDQFLGIKVPDIRRVVKKNKDYLNKHLITCMLDSPWHEDRMFGTLGMVYCYQKQKHNRKDWALFFLQALRDNKINNWDLVDSSAYFILGDYLQNRPKDMLFALAKSKHLWSQRTAVVACMTYARKGECEPLHSIVKQLMGHPHDLIHKACGWLLREAGKKNPSELYAFLDENARRMPRTMLRYAIEKIPSEKKKHYMNM